MNPDLRAALLTIALAMVLSFALIRLAEDEPAIYTLASAQLQTCLGAEEREYLRDLTLKGIDEAYQDHIIHLFEIWMKDHHEQPKRAINGTQIAISAHVRARNNALNWSPPEC